MEVKEVADLTGISVRTLHHWDEIGLLVPERKASSGYRQYADRDLETLQQILFFKELGFPLKKIKDVLTDPSFDRQEALAAQRKMLLEKRSRLDQMIHLVERTLQHAKGEIGMTNEEKFAGFDFSQNPYEEEARKRWGDKAVDEANQKAVHSPEIADEMNAIYRRLADLRASSPASEEAQEAIGEWFRLLNRMGSYSLEAFKGLGEMYTADERFQKNIDQFGEGLADFMRRAMAEYAERRSK